MFNPDLPVEICRCVLVIDEDEGLYHYERTCEFCGHVWWSLHCKHDGRQNPCPACGRRAVPVNENWRDSDLTDADRSGNS